MNDIRSANIVSPLLKHCPESLPATWYHDPAHHQRELKAIWSRHWIYAGRANDQERNSVRRFEAADQNLIIVRDGSGSYTCFYNSCRHRGAELCRAETTRLKARLITCPYHEWSYDLRGELVRVPYASPTPDFRKADHGLLKVHLREWNGFLYVCLAADPPPFENAPDLGADALDNWPLENLVTGHTMVKEIACKWKVFWENYSECLHCPGIHPELSSLVPIYSKGLMAANEAPDWMPDTASQPLTKLKSGARSWTGNGQPCGPEFPGLSEAQRLAGQLFVTLWPAMYVVAHVDYIRTVSLRPMGPERTELRADWLFPPETMAAPDFDLDNVVSFVSTVIAEDSAASEMNQRGLKNAAFKAGRLMPQEFDVYNFQQWVRRELEREI